MTTVAYLMATRTGALPSVIPTGRAGQFLPCAFANMRLPTDPLFYFTLTLENIVVGSRYRITRQSTGEELAIGVASSTTEVISGVPSFSGNMLMDITIRKASGSPNYKIFDTAAYANQAGSSAYILQQLDE